MGPGRSQKTGVKNITLPQTSFAGGNDGEKPSMTIQKQWNNDGWSRKVFCQTIWVITNSPITFCGHPNTEMDTEINADHKRSLWIFCRNFNIEKVGEEHYWTAEKSLSTKEMLHSKI